RYFWQVRVWDGAGRASAWSAPAWWEMGLLEPGDWKASWIEPGLADDTSKPGPVPMLRREFQLRGSIARARAYVTAHGLYELYLNGQRVGDQLLTPGWTSYNKRLQYQTYDVTPLLRSGANAVGALLGNGWYRGNLAFSERRNIYGDRLGLLAQIEVTYKDGRTETIASDAGWKAATGPILMSEIYHGETYDARLEKPGWATAGFDDRAWPAVKVAAAGKEALIAPAGPPVQRIQEIRPVKIFTTPGGDTVADMGQNMVGWVRLAVEGPAGTTVTVRHAEVLDKDGNFYTANLRKARATVQYTLKGGVRETFEPHFTFFGFRYVAVSRYPGTLTPDSLTGIVVHSAMAPAGELTTSKPLVNQLQHNIGWGQKGNFLDVPTDCPQRDERLGWTGDAQVFSPTAAFNMDVAGFFTKWLGDVAADQYDDGSVPHVIPNVLVVNSSGRRPSGAAGWADAAVIIPWTMYVSYGDKRILEQQYDSMARWVGYEKTRAGDDFIWDGDFHFGDWLAYQAPPGQAPGYPGATTGTDLLATAFFAHSTDLLARMARILGKTEDAARYEQQLARIKEAFVREYVTSTGRVGENTQTAYAVALQFDLLPEELRAAAARRLAEDVRRRKHLTTGFLGTPYLCHVLTRYGYLDEAYLLLNREDYPSWLYPVKQGATTIWERWDGQKPDGTFQDVGMNSFNHYAYGAIGDWMYRVMAGIDTDDAAPGYKHILLQPRPGGGFTDVKASHETPYGKVASAWTIKDGTFDLRVEVPANTRATVRLPNARLATVTEGGQPLANGNGVGTPRQEGDAVVLDVGSGAYRFAYPMEAR
ncbi:MAG TPA: glycoside hydrolase family 78 protein, partial [Vicinamibacteria bacterium]|nr:glycoside hydrolase family 78 protein [Vicinamibacteria bacterium]